MEKMNLEKYDTHQTLDDDIEDLIKIDSKNKNIDTLILNIIQKYSMLYLSKGNKENNFSLLYIKDKVSSRIDNLLKEYEELNDYFYVGADVEGKEVEKLIKKSELRELQKFMYSIDCLLDIPATSEIFKEIILLTLKKKEKFTQLELGSGSGILSLAGFISAKRIGNTNINGIGFEIGKLNLDNSNRVMQEVELTRGNISFIEKDLTNKDYNSYLKRYGKLDLVIAEIFSKYIPRFSYDKDNKILIPGERDISVFNEKSSSEKYADPFFDALNYLNKEIQLFENVEEGNTILWPNVTMGHLRINDNNSKIFVNFREKFVNLRDVGLPFSEYENIGFLEAVRWS